MIANDNVITQTQTEIANILNADSELSAVGFIIENRKDIEFEIESRLKKQGICGIIMTPTLTFQGITGDHKDIVYQCDNLTIQITEYVPINRAKNKTDCQTSQDIAIKVADILGSPSYTNFQNFQIVDIQTGEDNGLLVSKVTIQCLVQGDLSALPSPVDPSIKIPYALKTQLDELSVHFESEISSIPVVDTYDKTTIDNKDEAVKNECLSYTEQMGTTIGESIINAVVECKQYTEDYTQEYTYNKDTINDKINEFAAHYLTWKDDSGQFVQFKSHGSLPNPEKGSLLWARLNHTASNPQFWYGDDPHTPDKNDYCVILEDETHDNEVTRYSYVGEWPDGKWRYQYTINETALTTDQWAAINSTATKTKIDQITTNTSDIQTLNSKVQTIDGYQDTLLSGITENDETVEFYILTKSIS